MRKPNQRFPLRLLNSAALGLAPIASGPLASAGGTAAVGRGTTLYDAGPGLPSAIPPLMGYGPIGSLPYVSGTGIVAALGPSR